MLAAENRLRTSQDFAQTVKRGSRSGRSTVVAYALASHDASAAPAVGFVVSKAVGGAVQRNRVKRRLRAISREVVPQMPRGAHLVIRALPAAATSDYQQLTSDVTGAAATSLRRACGDAVRGPLSSGQQGSA